MLSVKLFGTGTASYFDTPIVGFPSHQSYLVFCYLLVNRHRKLDRARLASVFWGNYSTNISRKYLRNALWRLRSVFQSAGAVLENYLLIDDDSIAFQETSPYLLDVEVFETLLSGSREIPGDKLSPEQVQQIKRAVDLYDGDFLEGVDEEWCLYERERLSLLYLNALGKLMLYYRTHNCYQLGLDCGERILAFDNTRESIHREMMLLYWLLGEPQQALEQYKRCEQILRDQVGVEPADETRQLYQQMLHHRIGAGRLAGIVPVSGDTKLIQPQENLAGTVNAYAIQQIHQLLQVIREVNEGLLRLEDLLLQSCE